MATPGPATAPKSKRRRETQKSRGAVGIGLEVLDAIQHDDERLCTQKGCSIAHDVQVHSEDLLFRDGRQ
jgi:hypothetical protein